jgi:hypothetical protein
MKYVYIEYDNLSVILFWRLQICPKSLAFELEMVYISPSACVSLLNFRNEIEADYIGIMLLAAAGFDPCVAPVPCGLPEARGHPWRLGMERLLRLSPFVEDKNTTFITRQDHEWGIETVPQTSLRQGSHWLTVASSCVDSYFTVTSKEFWKYVPFLVLGWMHDIVAATMKWQVLTWCTN